MDEVTKKSAKAFNCDALRHSPHPSLRDTFPVKGKAYNPQFIYPFIKHDEGTDSEAKPLIVINYNLQFIIPLHLQQYYILIKIIANFGTICYYNAKPIEYKK